MPKRMKVHWKEMANKEKAVPLPVLCGRGHGPRGSLLTYVGYAKNTRPGHFYLGLLSGCIGSNQPWGMRQRLPTGQRAGLLPLTMKVVKAPRSVPQLWHRPNNGVCDFHPGPPVSPPRGLRSLGNPHQPTLGRATRCAGIIKSSDLTKESHAFCRHSWNSKGKNPRPFAFSMRRFIRELKSPMWDIVNLWQFLPF